MNNEQVKTPIHLWIIGAVSLLWNAFGAFDYTATQLQLESYMGQFTEAQLAYFYGFPAWVVAFWALGVWGALAGSLGLLLRKGWAVWAFGISLIGLIGSSLYTLYLSEGADIMGQTGITFSIVIWSLAVLLLLYAAWMRRRGVLR